MNWPLTTQNQEYIDRLYTELENIDPECRNGEVRILSSDTPEIKKQKELRIRGYENACKRFARICAARVEHIHSHYQQYPEMTFAQYGENSIPESFTPMVSLEEYQRLCNNIYSVNKSKINMLVEEIYWQRKKFPGAITLDSIKRGFRLVFGTLGEPSPHIILGWDLENPQVLYIDRYWIII